MPVAINVKRTKVFANTAARVSAKPDFAGQIGIQLDNLSIWQATSLTVGAWSGQFRMDTGLRTPYVELPSQGGTPPATPSGAVRVYCLAPNELAVLTTGGSNAIFELNGISGDRIYTLPNTSGTFALSETAETFTRIFINGTGGGGYVELTNQASAPGTPTGAARLYAAANTLGVRFASGSSALFSAAALTNDRTYTLPDASGTLMLTADLTGTANQITVTGTTLSIASGHGLIKTGNTGDVTTWVPEFAGQLLTSSDGVSFAISRASGAGNAGLDLVCLNNRLYFKNLTIETSMEQTGGSFSSRSIVVQSGFNILITGGSLSVTTGAGNSATFESGNDTGASPWTYRNTAAAGLTNTDWLQSDSIGGVTVGTGNASAGAVYARRGIIETFFGLAGGVSGKAMPLDVRQFGEYSGADEGHVMQTWDSDAGVTIFGYTAAVERATQRVLITPEAHVTIGGGTTASELRLLEPSGSGTNYTAFKAQAQGATVTYTLPPDDGDSGEVLTTNGSGSLTWEASAAGVAINNVAAGRLTLTSATPVLTTTVTGAGTVYFTPYNGNAIALYNGSSWEVKTFTELSITLSGLSASTAYDVWAYNNAGTVALDTTAWTNVTTRATALAFQDGVYVKNGDATRRYIGSIVLDGSKQCAVNFGASADGGTAGRCDIWNANNRVDIAFCVRDTTNSWAWATTSWQQANASAGNQVTVFLGLSLPVRGSYTTTSGGTTNIRYAGIGMDSTSALANFATSFAMPPGGSAAASSGHVAMFDGLIDVGQHYLAAIEFGNGSVTFYGDNGTAQLRSGLIVRSQY